MLSGIAGNRKGENFVKKRGAALLTAAVLLLCLLPAPAKGAVNGTVCFIAINDKLITPLDKVPMPIWVGEVLYAPVGAFDPNLSEASLGFFCIQSQTGGTVTLYNLRQMLVFDMNEGLSRNQHTGETFADQAITRSGNTFLPVKAVCDFFGLEQSYILTEYGYLLRMKGKLGDSYFLTDEAFVDAARNLMRDNLNKYNQSLIPVPPEEPDPPTPPPPTTVEPLPANVRLCLAFRCDREDGLEDILGLLDGLGCKGLFFFEPERLARRDDMVRRILCAGHSVGLLAEGEDVESTRALLEQGNQLLSHIARTAATAALVPSDQRAQLEEEGWSCWRETVDAIPLEEDNANTYMVRIDRAVGRQTRTVYLTMDTGERTAQMLPSLFQWIEKEGYTTLAPLETRL